MPSKELVTTKRSEHLGQLLELYMRGDTHVTISKKLDLTKQQVDKSLMSFRTDYLGTLSIRGILPRYQHLSEAVDKVNEPFYSLLSPIEESLSNEEMLYCAYYVSTGNSLEAVRLSGLDIGLVITTEGTREIRDKNCLLRSEMLKRKKNVQEEIRRLQIDKLELLDITKDKILSMHIDMIEQLRDGGNPRDKSNIVKLLDQVNKMQGNYSVTVRNEEITADDVLDGMLAVFEAELPEELREQPELEEIDEDS